VPTEHFSFFSDIFFSFVVDHPEDYFLFYSIGSPTAKTVNIVLAFPPPRPILSIERYNFLEGVFSTIENPRFQRAFPIPSFQLNQEQ